MHLKVKCSPAMILRHLIFVLAVAYINFYSEAYLALKLC